MRSCNNEKQINGYSHLSNFKTFEILAMAIFLLIPKGIGNELMSS